MATHKIILYAKYWYPEIPAPGKGRKNTARQKPSVLLGPKEKKIVNKLRQMGNAKLVEK